MDADLDPFGDVFDEPAAGARARPAGKFQPKARPRKGKAAAVAPPVHATAAANKPNEVASDGDATLRDLDSSAVENADIILELDVIHDLVTQPTSDTGISVPCTDEGIDEPRSSSLVQESADSSELRRSDMATKDPVAVDTDGERLQSELQASGDFLDMEATNVFSESAVASGKGHDDGVLPDGVESPVPPEATDFIASETRYGSESSLPTAQDDVVDYYSSMSFDDYLPSTPAASEFPMNSDQIDSRKICDLNEGQESREKHGLESDLTRKSNNSSLDIGKNGGKVLRKRSGTRQAVNQPENEGHADGNPPGEAPGCPVIDEENDSEYQVDEDENNDKGGDDGFDGGENSGKKKRASKRSKKSVPDKGTGGRKRKKACETSEESSQKPPKKFAHTTRRKKRYRNDELLKVPDDEIDFRSLPMRDIIFLGEHRERLAVVISGRSSPMCLYVQAKEAKEAKALNQGTSNNEVDDVEPEEAGIVSGTPLFNSHSFMNRTRTVRWSKQETDLFYEGIRQFGTDLSLVQQLFPGRDRRQIKNKFKAEERRQPFLLHEAVGNRDRDNSYFVRVIDQLRKAAAEAGRDLNRDHPTDEAEEEEEQNSETNEEAGHSEQDEAATAGQDPEGIVAEAPSPEEEIIDEDDLWSSYKSEF
ncbi:unnamed protein product [Linum tenue]|uniref:Myb-like domain-containing protein n=1 Tax=Linum tenue TaxID=586396 RepID=A0AAV0LWM9_9ROSI|nr:unnamed protein product [Linum tenue]